MSSADKENLPDGGYVIKFRREDQDNNLCEFFQNTLPEIKKFIRDNEISEYKIFELIEYNEKKNDQWYKRFIFLVFIILSLSNVVIASLFVLVFTIAWGYYSPVEEEGDHDILS